jgi:predicted DNA-binding transcriptional regulator YafY
MQKFRFTITNSEVVQWTLRNSYLKLLHSDFRLKYQVKRTVEDIELLFSTTIAPYLKTLHVHHSQKIVREDANGLVIALRLIPNPELTQLILSYGPDVKVLKPEGLRKQVEDLWRRAVNGLFLHAAKQDS